MGALAVAFQISRGVWENGAANPTMVYNRRKYCDDWRPRYAVTAGCGINDLATAPALNTVRAVHEVGHGPSSQIVDVIAHIAPMFCGNPGLVLRYASSQVCDPTGR